VSNTSLPKNAARVSRERLFFILKEAEKRYRNELMDEDERCLLHDRIVRLKIRLAENA
jgi:hypothetical protein